MRYAIILGFCYTFSPIYYLINIAYLISAIFQCTLATLLWYKHLHDAH